MVGSQKMASPDGKGRNKLRLPRIRKAKLSSFSLYSLKPEIDVHFPKGVFCLAGANGLGKSTFLLALNYAITGIVPEPGRPFRSAEEYYKHCLDFTESFFSGRIEEHDRDVASVSVELQVGAYTYELTRDMFHPTELQQLSIIETATGRSCIDPTNMSEEERHATYCDEISKHVGLESFEQLVFLQHFVLTFDERRHLLFWHPRELEQSLYLAFGVDSAQAHRAETLRRQIDRAESRMRNHNYQATRIRNEIRNIEETVHNQIETESDTSVALVEEHKELQSILDNLNEKGETLAAELADANLRMSELSAQQATLRSEYTQEFSKRIKTKSHLGRHPVIASSLREGKCQLCESVDPRVRANIESRISGNECPVCGSRVSAAKDDPDSERRLRDLDKRLAKVGMQLNDALSKRDRLNEEVRIATADRDDASVRLERFEAVNQGALSKVPGGSGEAVDSLLKSYREQMQDFLKKKKEEYARREQLKRELKPTQKLLQQGYATVEEEFVPLFNAFASSFLGIDLDLQLEAKGEVGIGLTVDVRGSRRRQEHQLSESQRFFIDIALRMALVEFMCDVELGACLYVDTPEGSLDIAYETTAGRMFAQFVRKGYGIIMTANINSSQLLRSLAHECGRANMAITRMTSWAELSEVQEREEQLFQSAFAKIEKSLK